MKRPSWVNPEYRIEQLQKQSAEVDPAIRAKLDEPVYWSGRQWAVTAYGIESVGEFEYFIEAERLNENDWFDHMAGKTWVDLPDFAAALYIARYVHRGEV